MKDRAVLAGAGKANPWRGGWNVADRGASEQEYVLKKFGRRMICIGGSWRDGYVVAAEWYLGDRS